jgi:hypothetical protein
MGKKLSFGVEPNMREVPPGESATMKLANWNKWEIKETEYGNKYCIPITLFSHPSYESIPSKGIECNWLSKSIAAKSLFDWIFVDLGEGSYELEPKEFDFDLEKEFKVKWKITRLETGGYRVEQL